MAGAMQRLGLSEGSQWDQIRTIVRRIDIQAASIVVHLYRVNALAAWRTAVSAGVGGRDRDVIDHRRGALASGETIADEGEALILSLPVRARFHGGRASILNHSDAHSGAAQADMALIKAVARAHRWRQMLLDGEATSIEALAIRFNLDRGHVGLVLNLAFLSPDLTRAILCGEQPPGLRLTHLLDADIPLSWKAQREMFDRLEAH